MILLCVTHANSEISWAWDYFLAGTSVGSKVVSLFSEYVYLKRSLQYWDYSFLYHK